MSAMHNLPGSSLYAPEDRSIDFKEAVEDQQNELLMRLLRNCEKAADVLNQLNGFGPSPDFLAPGVIDLLNTRYEDRAAMCMAWLDGIREQLLESQRTEAEKLVRTGEYA